MSYELIPYDQLKRSPVNVSKNATMAPEFLQRMNKSMHHVGIVQPLVVRPNGEGYEVVAGDNIAQQNAKATGKQLRQLILEHAPATWRPSYFHFPAQHYTARTTTL